LRVANDASRHTPAPLGRREQKKLATRLELLTAGRRLFAARGLFEARIEDVAALAGVAKGTVYGYFRSKEELAHAVVTLGFLELQTEVRRTVGRAVSQAQCVGRIVDAHAAFFSDNPDLLRVFHQVRGALKFDRPEWRPLRRALSNHLSVLAEMLHETRTDGALRARSRLEASTLFGALSGVLSVKVSLSPRSVRPRLSRDERQGLVRLVLSMEGSPGAALRRPERHDTLM